jgi:predicted aminopeptidase
MRFKFFKKFGYLADIVLMAVFLYASANTPLIIYGIDQARGQWQIIRNARPFDEVLAGSTTPDSIKSKLRLIGEIKQFAIDSCGLKPTANYTTFYDQHNKPLLWVLTASGPYELKAYEWKFPLLGTVSYKGFFNYRKGKSEEQALKFRHYDTDYDDVSAWSTLGWFRDPVLSGMLRRDAGSLAELIIHEMTHGTIYLKSSVDFNENFANMVGEEGAIRFLTAKYGGESAELKKYLRWKSDYDLYSHYMIASAAKLDSLYKTLSSTESDWDKEKKKVMMMKSIVSGTDTIPFKEPGRFGKLFSHRLPNNTWFLSFRRYDQQKDSLRDEMYRKFNGDLKEYIALVRARKR